MVYAGVEPVLDRYMVFTLMASRCRVSSLHTRILCLAHLSFAVLWVGPSTSTIPLGVWGSAMILRSVQAVNQLSTFQIPQVSVTQLEVCTQLWISSILLDFEFWDCTALNGRQMAPEGHSLGHLRHRALQCQGCP